MINYYISENEKLKKIDKAQNGCWISMVQPTVQELDFIAKKYNIEDDAIKAAMDIDERSRIEIDENFTMILVNIPIV